MKLALKFLTIFISLFFISCENEPVDRANRNQVIAVNSELYNLIDKAADSDFKNDITCIDFNYPFNLAVFDAGLNLLYYETVENDAAFVVILQNLEAGLSIAMSYPITSVLDSGATYQINNNEELLEAIKKCTIADEVQTCHGILVKRLCVWKITHLSGPNTEYTNSYFEVTELGNAGFYYNNNIYAGSWITYAIENEPHLNIFLGDTGEIAADWNYDWKITEYADESITITNNIDTYILNRECTPNCIKYVFEECETQTGSQTAVFNLPEYIECFLPFTGITDASTISVSFFENNEDLNNNENQIISPYTNTQNPQVIYVRIEDLATGDYLTSLPILLIAVTCED